MKSMGDLQQLNSWENSSLPVPAFQGRNLPAVRHLVKGANARQESPPSLLMEYYHLLARRRGLLVMFTICGALLGFGSTMAVLPVFRARTSLDIQNINADFMNMRDIKATAGGENTSSEAYVQTQIKLLQSDTLRNRTVERMRKSGYVLPLLREDMLSQWKRSLGLHGGEPLSKKELLAYAAKSVTVKPLGVTRLVEVTCDSWDTRFSAAFCNTLTQEFADQDREVRWNEAQHTSEWLSRQLKDVRESLKLSEKRLETSTGNAAPLSRQGGESVADEKLRELQAELMRAAADRVAKQAQYQISTSAAAEQLPAVLDSGQFRESQARLDDLRRQVAALVPPLTEENPKVQHLRAQIREVQASLSTQKVDLVQRMRNEFEQAKHREALLFTAYSVQEAIVSREQGKEAQVSMLRHEVESSQQLYSTLLQRVKEAGFASAMQASTIRVVDAAVAPEIPIAPRRGMSSAVGLLLGMLVGVICAFMKERTQTVLRGPGEVPRYLMLRELGVIPSAKRTLQDGPGKMLPARFAAMFARAKESQRAGNKSQKGVLDMVVWQDHVSLVAEAFRSTTYSVLLAGRDTDKGKTYVVSSPNSGEGKTTVTCNLGLALAQANQRVLLIDGDLRKPRLHTAMSLSNEIGMRNLLRGDVDLDLVPVSAFSQPTKMPNLRVITSGTGTEEPSGLLHSPRCRALLQRLAQEFDIILIDSPPMLHLADARIFGGLSDGAILVFRSRVTDRETATNARDLFLNDHVRVIGTILNDFDPQKEGKAQYYGSYYAYRRQSRTLADFE
jgi:polysaccharide biosynthesis transport protein